MKKISLALLPVAIVSNIHAQNIHQFKPGDVATAESFNQNFNALKTISDQNKKEINDINDQTQERAEALETAININVTNIDNNSTTFLETFATLQNTIEKSTMAIENNVSTLSQRVDSISGDNALTQFVNATVNDITMKVSILPNQYGNYTVITPTGVLAEVGAEGELGRGNWLYFESSDCTGIPYVSNYNLEAKSPGYTYLNPQLEVPIQLYSYKDMIYYRAPSSDLVILNYGSSILSYKNTSGCQKNTNHSIEMAVKLDENNPEITGLSTLPVVIEGVGKALTVTAEVGSKTSKFYNVYANGVKIGKVEEYGLPNRNSTEKSSYLTNVSLDNFENQRINLYKNGSYDANWFQEKSLYYLQGNCTGSAYVEVIWNAKDAWLDTSKISTQEIKNSGNYYSLSEENYKASEGMNSYKSNYGACINSKNNFDNVYKLAIPITSPTLPTFNPPITVEGWEEATPYNTLPEAS